MAAEVAGVPGADHVIVSSNPPVVGGGGVRGRGSYAQIHQRLMANRRAAAVAAEVASREGSAFVTAHGDTASVASTFSRAATVGDADDVAVDFDAMPVGTDGAGGGRRAGF